MVRAPYVDKNGTRRGAWSEEEDNKLREYVLRYGHWNWRQLPKFAGLTRCGKSCRLRWINYLKPGVKRGNYTPEEESLILELYAKYGSKWSWIAAQLPGRIDNDIKNHFHGHLKKKMNDGAQAPNESDSTANEMEDHGFSVEPESDSSSMSTVIETDSVSSSATAQLQDSPSGASMDSFWDLPFVSDDHQQSDELQWINSGLNYLPFHADLEEEIMRPFSPCLDEINMDCWLQELMQ